MFQAFFEERKSFLDVVEELDGEHPSQVRPGAQPNAVYKKHVPERRLADLIGVRPGTAATPIDQAERIVRNGSASGSFS